MIEQVTTICSYCGEQLEVQVDYSAGNQTYYEDCAICCHPMLFRIWVDEQGSLSHVETFREDE